MTLKFCEKVEMKDKDFKIIEMNNYSIIDTSGPPSDLSSSVDHLFERAVDIDPKKIKRGYSMNPNPNYFVTVVRDVEADGSPSLLAWDARGRAYQSFWSRDNYCYSEWEEVPYLDCPQVDNEKV